jgi:hypothetical protein
MLPVIAVTTAVLSVAPPADAATTTCVPVTIDSVDVACVSVDVTPVQTSSGETITATVEVTVDGQSLPPVVVPVTVPAASLCENTGVTNFPGDPDPVFYVLVGVEANGVCTGAAVAVDNAVPGLMAQTTDVPYRVPEICITTTGTCVGPLSGTVPVVVPTGTSGSERVCVATDNGAPGALTPLVCVPLLS